MTGRGVAANPRRPTGRVGRGEIEGMSRKLRRTSDKTLNCKRCGRGIQVPHSFVARNGGWAVNYGLPVQYCPNCRNAYKPWNPV